MRIKLWSSIGMMALLFGFASGASAKDQEKSWEVDLYDGDAEVTYVPDGRDDVHVYDHNNHYNDRSYIEERPHYGYQGGYQGGYQDRGVSLQINSGGYDRHDDYYDNRRAYVPRHYRSTPRYRLEYHNRYRGW